MDLEGMSTNGLRSLHQGVVTALAADDETPPGQDKKFGARESPDWKRWGDALEAELTRRGETFTAIGWDHGNP